MTPHVQNRDAIDIYWLGQAGFWIDFFGTRIVIDPYLSNSLAKKYAGKRFPHERMMQPPITVDRLPRPDLVLVTHAHTDHMDPETLAPLSSRFPDVPVIVPVATKKVALERIGNVDAIRTIDAGLEIEVENQLTIKAFPAAHERFDVTADGHHPYLGYGVAKADRRIYHSGDTVPFDGMEDLVGAYAPEIALLPINGRDEYRKSNGVPGNMTATEAVSLCIDTGIRHLVPHHFGMFDFNTADPDDAVECARHLSSLNIHIPVPGKAIRFD